MHFSAVLALVCVVPPVIEIPTLLDSYISSDIQTAQARAEKELEEVVEKRVARKVRIRTKLVMGDPGDEIVETTTGEED